MKNMTTNNNANDKIDAALCAAQKPFEAIV